MICAIAGKQPDIPADWIYELKTMGMVGTSNGVVSEADIARADEVVTEGITSHCPGMLEVQHMRLYIELPDRTSTQTLPVGVQVEIVRRHWQFLLVNTIDLYNQGKGVC